MSSLAPESSNPLEMGVDIPSNDDKESVAKEWERCMKGYEQRFRRQREGRRMEKLPWSLSKSEKSREYYEPAVVSLGPYHYKGTHLAEAVEYKLIILQEYCLSTNVTSDFLYNKVFEVVHDARKCYIDGSTDAYNDEKFNRMMLLDACFILFFIESISDNNIKRMLPNEYLGAMEFINIMRDIFLLENQIPFIVLEVLLTFKFSDDKGEHILNGFFNYLNHGAVQSKRDDIKKVLEYKKPLHLLELYRSYFISLPSFHSLDHPNPSIEEDSDDDEYNLVKRNRWFASATELKAKWIFLSESKSGDHDMTFNINGWYGEFKIARRAVSSYTKAIYMNMIAYEMCPHNPNDFRVTTYVRVMKALIIQDKDVKKLRDNDVLTHGLGRDEDVVKMFNEIEVPAITLPIFNELRHKIKKIHQSKYKTWVAELSTDYLGSPWKVVGLLVAAALLITTIVQTHLAIHPRGR